MTWLDYGIFTLYMLAVVGVGYYFYLKNRTAEDYYVGGRGISPGHVGLSVAATDVGGGFSIGLGGLGYAMGLAGSWLLFTGLVGAWLSAVFIIPRIKKVDVQQGMMTYPDFLRFRYGGRVAMVAAVISALGYLGFTSGQILAGAKLMAGSMINWSPPGMELTTFAILIIGTVIVVYTVLGGLKAVIYTDTVQWIVLMLGLVGFAIPFTLLEVGGIAGLREVLPRSHFDLFHLTPLQFANWFITIAPIWVVAMTLYQRMFATRTTREAQKAWFIAGLFEYPFMAFAGVILGLMSRVLFPGIDAELGVPMLLATVLPMGIAGIVVASYFSAIMSTADSCIIASSGNVVGDIIQRSPWKLEDHKAEVRVSQVVTLLLGVVAVLIASRFAMVLDAILQAYSFLVAGLFVPTLGAYFWDRASPRGAFWAMVIGGGTTLGLLVTGTTPPLGLDPSFWGILVSTVIFIPLSLLDPAEAETPAPEPKKITPGQDEILKLGNSLIQHGPASDRIYGLKLHSADMPEILDRLEEMAAQRRYGKLFIKTRSAYLDELRAREFEIEARIPEFFGPGDDGVMAGKFLDPHRVRDQDPERVKTVLQAAREAAGSEPSSPPGDGLEVREIRDPHSPELQAVAACYDAVFESYPFPIHDPEFLGHAMEDGTRFFTAWEGHALAAASSMEPGGAQGTVEMTDFATLPDYRGHGLATILLTAMDEAAEESGVRVAYTIARAVSYGMNITFARRGYEYSGTLVNNTQIGGSIESMNVWYKLVGAD